VKDGDKDRAKNCGLDFGALKLLDRVHEKRVEEFLHPKFVYRLI
jgi:hypothetical protein